MKFFICMIYQSNGRKNIRGDIPRKINKYTNILSYIQKSTASNIDLEVTEETVSDMATEKIIDKDIATHILYTISKMLKLKLFVSKKEAKLVKNQRMNQ